MLSKILFILIVLFFAFEINAQNEIPKKEVKAEGWNLPSTNDFKEGEKGSVMLNVSGQTEKIAVYVQVFIPKTPLRIRRETNSADKEKAAETEVYSEIRDFRAYSINGKVFAYEIQTVGYKCSEGICGYLGCASDSFYLDEDGDGKFEARYYTWELPLVPDWTKK